MQISASMLSLIRAANFFGCSRIISIQVYNDVRVWEVEFFHLTSLFKGERLVYDWNQSHVNAELNVSSQFGTIQSLQEYKSLEFCTEFFFFNGFLLVSLSFFFFFLNLFPFFPVLLTQRYLQVMLDFI